MSLDDALGSSFKPEIRSSGAKLVAQEKVLLSHGSDLTVQAYIRSSPSYKVQLVAPSIDSDIIIAKCSCPIGKKAQFCKHVWATLLCAEVAAPDFITGKRSIEKAPSEHNPEVNNRAAAAKARAGEYRKVQYEKQKARVKEMKRSKSGRDAAAVEAKSFPPDVETALAYFTKNGFPMADGLSELELGEGKRKLSRVFHPDRGGTHEEITELNTQWEILIRYLKS